MEKEEFPPRGLCEYCGNPLDDRVWISIDHTAGRRMNPVLLTCHRCDVPGSSDVEINHFTEDPVEWLVRLSEQNRLSDEAAVRFLQVFRKVNEFVEWRQSKSQNQTTGKG